MREHDLKKTSILEYPKRNVWTYEIVPSDRYEPIYDEEEASLLSNAYAEYAGGMLYDSPTVCLEGIEDGERLTKNVKLSVGSFYDFALANVIGREASDADARIIRSMRASGVSDDLCEIVELLGFGYARAKQSSKSFEQLVLTPYLPNTIATSILVFDEVGNFLLSKRTDNVIIGKRFGGVSATGTVDPGDLIAADGVTFDDPFCACASRELNEETGLSFPSSAFRMRGFVAGHAKLQPIAIVDVMSEAPLDRSFDIHLGNEKQDEAELLRLVSIPKSRLPHMIETHDMTEASAYHIGLHL